ncbi:hypothetical protein [Aquirufa ecclesiirivi]|uniref:hypothetical protein n=1 Tax=Aquirufa ecclesiirivi TaxID=2715124 RepID=UPI003BAEAFC1
MKIKLLIDSNKENIIPKLFEWAETFDWQLDEDGEKTMEPYNEIFTLAQRLEKGNCNEDDLKNILFHIEQINYNEIKIRL